MLRAQLFGVPEISINGQSFARALAGRQLALFAYLLTQEHPVPRPRLSDLLWRDLPEAQAREQLRSLLSHTRRAVGDYLLTDRQAVTFNRTAPYWVDLEVFTSFWAAGQRRAEPALLEQTLQIYRGEFLAGFYIQNAPAFEAWLLAQRQQWQDRAVRGWQQLACYHFTQANDTAGLVANTQLLTLEPWNEAAHRRQMLMLARSGQRNTALAYFDDCCAILRTEVDAPPDEETMTVYEQIKAGVWPPTRPDSNPSAAITIAANGNTNQSAQATPMHNRAANGQPGATSVRAAAPLSIPIDWGSMPHEPRFHGRAAELAQLHQWCVQERRRVVTVLGFGGQGKTALVVRFIRELTAAPKAEAEPAFERVISRSLLAAPPLTDILQEWLQQLSDQQVVSRAATQEQQFTLLYEYLQQRRFLLVLDNVESVLEPDGSGACRPGYEAYEQLWQLLLQRDHACCLLLTCRERPRLLNTHQEQVGALRTLLLDGLTGAEGAQLLCSYRIGGNDAAILQLLECYSGNPLALKLVADTIDELFNGRVEAFLQAEAPFFADISTVLDQQFARLSPLEVDLLTWLALEQEPVTSQTLWENLVAPPAKQDFLTALRALVRRSLVQMQGERFSLQNVILEYTRERLIQRLGAELTEETVLPTQTTSLKTIVLNAPATAAFNRYALRKAQAKAYVQAGQQRLIVAPLTRRLQQYWGERGVQPLLYQLLQTLRTHQATLGPFANGYAASNCLHLLLHLQGEIQGADFSQLTLRQADLRAVALSAVNFAVTHFQDCLFTDSFAAITALAFHPSGDWLAIGTYDGAIRLVRRTDQQVLRLLAGHTNILFGLAIAPDGKLLASSSVDQQVCVWDLETYRLRYRLLETVNYVRSVSFSPDNRWLALAGGDGTLRLYEAATGELRHTVCSSSAWLYAVAFSPDGQWVAVGSCEGDISLWSLNALSAPVGTRPSCTLCGHSHAVETLVFSQDSQLLFSGSRDHLIHVWALANALDGQTAPVEAQEQTPWRTLRGHDKPLRRLAISPDGRYLASAAADGLVHLWDVKTGVRLDTLVSHQRWVWAVAFHPRMVDHTCLLASAANDQRVLFWEINRQEGVVRSQAYQSLAGYSDAVRALTFLHQPPQLVSGGFNRLVYIWDMQSKHPAKVLTGHSDWIFSLAVSPDGRWLASAGYEREIYLWSLATPHPTPMTVGRHAAIITSLAFSPDGQSLASCCQDGKISLWNVQTRRLLQTVSWQNTLTYAVAFSPDGHSLASAHFDQTVHLWEVQRPTDGEQPVSVYHRQTLIGHTGLVWMVAFTPDGQTVISTSNDQTVRLWDSAGQPRQVLTGHTEAVRALAVSPRLVDGGYQIATGGDDGVILIWDGPSGALRRRLQGHPRGIHSLAYSTDGLLLASADEEGNIHLWEGETGIHLQTFRAPRPYTDMNITGATGITPAQRAALLALGAIDNAG